MTELTYPRTERTTPHRMRDRMAYERGTAHAILDEAYHCHLGFVVDGEPRVLPTLHVRLADTVYLHGSTGSGPLLAARGPQGLAVCLAVTQLDALVLARSQFHHSANYRSVIAHGIARLVTDEAEKLRALTALVDKVGPGRSRHTRPPNRREIAETAVLALPLHEVAVRARVGGVADEPEDLALPHWAGLLPLRLVSGPAEPDPGVQAPLPDYLVARRSSWYEAAGWQGERLSLAGLALSHVDGLLTATNDAGIWGHTPRPGSRDEMAAYVAAALREHASGRRVPWAVLRGDEVIGTISYHAIDERQRSLAIGHTVLAASAWGTGVDAEAAMLVLIRRAFEDLGAVRVEWHLDPDDAAGIRAVHRLGAEREGVRRAHRRAPDGTWRDTVGYAMTARDWPATLDRFSAAPAIH